MRRHFLSHWVANVFSPLVLALLLGLFGAPGSASGQADPVYGYWEGALTFRGADLAIRLHFQRFGHTVRATLDIPSLVMAWEPVPVTLAEGGVEIELPFGLGTFPIVPDGDQVLAEKAFQDGTFVLQLERSGPPPFSPEEVGFRSGEVDLAGTLLLPPGQARHPGIVLLHGSGQVGRSDWAYRSWADVLVRKGFAVLYYDKRGVGGSGGEVGAGLRQLADDGIAAVKYLRGKPEINPRRVGLNGSSQGAWIAEQVAADLGDISFLLLISAAGSSPRAQQMQSIEYGMRSDGRSEAQIEDALTYLGLYFYVARTGQGWSELQKAVKRAQTENDTWGQYVDQPKSESDLAWWREAHGCQPAGLVKDLDVPVLLLYGGADWITPPVENAARLKSFFPAPEKVVVKIFPGADHRLELEPGPDAEGNWQWFRMAPGVLETISRWLAEETLRRPRL